jgi:hypothetical protein
MTLAERNGLFLLAGSICVGFAMHNGWWGAAIFCFSFAIARVAEAIAEHIRKTIP